MFILFLLQNINSHVKVVILERRLKRVPTIYVLSKTIKKTNIKFDLNFSCLTAQRTAYCMDISSLLACTNQVPELDTLKD